MNRTKHKRNTLYIADTARNSTKPNCLVIWKDNEAAVDFWVSEEGIKNETYCREHYKDFQYPAHYIVYVLAGIYLVVEVSRTNSIRF